MNKKIFLSLATMGFILACGHPTALNQDGSPSGALHWPEVGDVTMSNKLGFEMNKENLKKLRAGLSRDNLYYLLGRPHFSEGFRVREWDYLVYFSKKGGRQACILKVLFDTDKIAQYYHWKAVDPETGICPPEGLYDGYYTLDAPMLFAFDGADYGSLSEEGQRHLYQIAKEINERETPPARLEIIGYSDVLGNEAYNQKLSQERAQTVYSYLKAQGVQAEQEIVIGLGAENAVVECDYLQNDRRAKIACLAPNRRVEIKLID